MASLSLTDFVAGNEITAAGHNSNNSTLETWSTSISDDNFSSSAGMYTAFRTLVCSQGVIQSGQAAGTYFVFNTGQNLIATTNDLATGATTQTPPCIYLDDADFTVSGRSTRLRVRAQVSTNGTVPAITFTFGLYPVTFSGAADVLTATLGTVVASSTVAIASPSANATTAGTSSEIAVPSDGLYTLGVLTSGNLTANNASLLTVALQQRWA